MKAFIYSSITFCQKHIEDFIYGGVGFLTYQIWETYILPIIVAAICALVSSFVKDKYRKWTNEREYKKNLFKSNGREN